MYSQDSSYYEISAINYGDDAFEGFVSAHVFPEKWDNTRQIRVSVELYARYQEDTVVFL